MWEIIPTLSTGFALVAFLGAVAAVVAHLYMLHRVQLIRSAPPTLRPKLVQDALEFFHIDAAKLTRDQQYQLALVQIRRRAERFRIIAILVVVLAIGGAAVSLADRFVGGGPPDVRVSKVLYMDFRPYRGPQIPSNTEPVAVTMPIELKNVSPNSRSGTLQRTVVKLPLPGKIYELPWFRFVNIGGGNWTETERQVKLTDLKAGESFSEEIMHISSLTWADFLIAFEKSTVPIIATVSVVLETQTIVLSCQFDPQEYVSQIPMYRYIGIECEQ